MNGGDTAFGDFVLQHGDALRRLAFLLTGTAGAAEDLLQSVLARLLPRWQRLVADGEPYPQVRAALVTAKPSRWRRRRQPDQSSAALLEPPVANERVAGWSPTASRAGWQQLRRALGALPEEQRKAVVLKHYELMSDAEIAAALGWPIDAVVRHAELGLRSLQEFSATGGVISLDDPPPLGDEAWR